MIYEIELTIDTLESISTMGMTIPEALIIIAEWNDDVDHSVLSTSSLLNISGYDVADSPTDDRTFILPYSLPVRATTVFERIGSVAAINNYVNFREFATEQLVLQNRHVDDVMSFVTRKKHHVSYTRTTLLVDTKTIDIAKRIGGGNTSLGIRKAVTASDGVSITTLYIGATTNISVRLPTAVMSSASKIGNGSMSRGVRRAVWWYANEYKPTS